MNIRRDFLPLIYLLGLGTVVQAGPVSSLLPPAEEPPAKAPAATTRSVADAMQAGVKYLKSTQAEDGSWSSTNYPALTGFAMMALMQSGVDAGAEPVKRAADFVTSCANNQGEFEGAIFRLLVGPKGGGLPNYNTAISMRALQMTGNPSYTPLVLGAREFLTRSQRLVKGMHYGGMGYDPPRGRAYADLSNSYLAYEAMNQTQALEDQRPGNKRVSLNWKAAIDYVEHCHNDPRFNDLPWASPDESEQGGFAYQHDTFRPNSGVYTDKDGVLRYRSMPGMSFAGLYSYLMAGITRDDPRVQATVKWIQANWQLERGNRNPDMNGKPEEKEGLFYMYLVLAKALDLYGQDTLTLADGSTVAWRKALTEKLVGLQDADGSWINPQGRYMEKDRNLVTAYVLLALAAAQGQ